VMLAGACACAADAAHNKAAAAAASRDLRWV